MTKEDRSDINEIPQGNHDFFMECVVSMPLHERSKTTAVRTRRRLINSEMEESIYSKGTVVWVKGGDRYRKAVILSSFKIPAILFRGSETFYAVRYLDHYPHGITYECVEHSRITGEADEDDNAQ